MSPAQIETGLFCATYFAEYQIPGSRPGVSYRVVLGGGEAPASCTCPAFTYSKAPVFDRECKHIRRVHQQACMWNCQWHEGNRIIGLRPTEIWSGNVVPDEHCPNCMGPVVAVRIAV